MPSRLSRSIIAAAAATTICLFNAPAAQADSETDFLNALTDSGIGIYDASRAVAVGYAICDAFNVANGADVAEYIYTHTSFSDVPDRATAAIWVLAAGANLCPWHYHPERDSGYVA